MFYLRLNLTSFMISMRMVADDDNSTTQSDALEVMRQPRLFIFLSTLLISSLICSIYLFVQFLKDHTLRQQVHNHITLALLTANFLQVRITINIRFEI